LYRLAQLKFKIITIQPQNHTLLPNKHNIPLYYMWTRTLSFMAIHSEIFNNMEACRLPPAPVLRSSRHRAVRFTPLRFVLASIAGPAYATNLTQKIIKNFKCKILIISHFSNHWGYHQIFFHKTFGRMEKE
jgi:hypothetical protein